MKKLSLAFAIVLLTFMQLSFISAGIYFSGLEDIYNIGDMINLEASVDPIIEGRLLKTTLVCNGNSVIEFNNLPDETGKVSIKLPLNNYTIDNIEGNCYFQGIYSGETRNSEVFDISKRLEVFLYSDSFFSNPGEEIVISGSARRLNGMPINGQIEISIPLLKTIEVTKTNRSDEVNNENQSEIEEVSIDSSITAGTFYGKVTNGEFSVPITLSEEAPAGNYRIDILVYEEVSGERSSEGVSLASLEIFQILKGIDIALNNQNVNPGELLEFKPGLLDQSGKNIDDEVSVIVKDRSLVSILEKIARSQETVSFTIPTNLTSGYYEIEARNGDLNTTKKFYVNEKSIVSFFLGNQTLVVTNIGNIPYNKDIEVFLNNKSFVKKINLALGEMQKFKLSGFNNDYDVKISDGESEFNQSGVRLTGFALNVDSVDDNRALSFITNPMIWIFIIVILAVGLLFLFRNIFKKKSFAYYSDNTKIKEISKPNIPVQKTDIVKPILSPQNKAEQVLVSNGHRSKATVIVLKIKNKIAESGKQTLEKAVELVYEKKGAVYDQGEFIYVVLSSLMTKTDKNESEAARIAEKFKIILNEHNRKFKDKIDYGIAINSGEIIGNIDGKKLKFTALGNLMISAKRLADLSDKNILISKEAYEKGMGEIKVKKLKVGNVEVNAIDNVTDSEKNKQFIDNFLKRMGDEKKQ